MNRKLKLYITLAGTLLTLSGSLPLFAAVDAIRPATGLHTEGMTAQSAISSGEITRVETHTTQTGQSLIFEATGSFEYTAFKLTRPPRLVLDINNMTPGALKAPLEIRKGGVHYIRPIYFDKARILRIEIGLEKMANYEISRLPGNALEITALTAKQETPVSEPQVPGTERQAPEPPAVPTIAQVTGQATAEVSETNSRNRGVESTQIDAKQEEDPCKKIYSAEKSRISFDFQRASLRNILRIISETGKFNLVISPGVDGTVTMRLDNIPWDQALDLVLRNNRLGKECLDTVMRIATQTALSQEESDRVAVRQAQTAAVTAEQNAQELFTEVVRINYSDLTSLQANLTPLATPRGNITQDTRTNTLILTDIRSVLDEMLALIKTLDIQTPQVMIEARIVEVNKNATQELGIQWGGTISRVTDKEFPNSIAVGAASQSTSGFIVDVPATGAPTASLGLSLGSLIGDTTLDVQLQALESQGRGKVLSSPKVTTLDNRQATIESGRQIPYQTVSQDGTQTQFVDASINLTVTPHITADDNIYMRISATKNAADFANSVNGVPTITTKNASTEVLVKDGDTTVLGGLYENNVTESQNRVPGMSDIPILGWLFRRNQDIDTVDELLIFITPVIVHNLEGFK